MPRAAAAPAESGCPLPEVRSGSVAELRERVAAGIACQETLLKEATAFQAELAAALPESEEVREAGELLDMVKSAWEGKLTVVWTEVRFGPDGSVTEHELSLTYEEAKLLLDQLDAATDLKDLNELDAFALQQAYIDYQQTIATLSALMQETQDDAHAILQNLSE